MNPQISQKLRNLSFLLMALICFIHGYNLNLEGWDAKPPFWISFFETFISDGICRSAVPTFFAISGFLAAQSLPEHFSFGYYKSLIGKKFQTLLIPYLSVSLLGIMFVISLQLIPYSDSFFSTYKLGKLTFTDWLRIWLFSPIPFPLWFIRFLFNYFLIFPIIYWGTKYLKPVYLFSVFYLWVSFKLQFILHIPKINAEGLFFFSLGLFIGIEKINLSIKPKKIYCLAVLIIWILWIAFRSEHLIRFPFDHSRNHYHLIGFTLLGVWVLWACYDHLPHMIKGGNWVTRHAPYTIGIFLFHEPLLTIFKKAIIRLGGATEAGYLLSYLISPIAAFLISLYFSKILSRIFPIAYRIFTGNRQPNQSA